MHAGARPYEALVLAGCLTLLGCAPKAAAPPQKPSILWIVVDTLRADHVPAYGYSRPTLHSIDRLVKHGVLFERAYAPQGDTTPSIATMLTGYEPWRHGLDTLGLKLPEGMRSVPEFLRASGYETAAFVSSFVMVGQFSGLSQGFDLYDDFLQGENDFQRRAGETLALAQTWVDARSGDSEKPFFCFVHLIDPHGPYDPPAAFAERFRSPTTRPITLEEIPRYQRRGGELDAQRFVDRYDSEIAYMDSQLERFFSALEASGKLDSLLVVVTADHGESLGEHGVHFEHGWNVHEETLRVPMILRPPLADSTIARGRRIPTPVGVMDLAPTVLAAAGVPRTGELDGVDLTPALRGELSERSKPLEPWSRKPLVVRSRRSRLSWGWIEGSRKVVAQATQFAPKESETTETEKRAWQPPLPGNLQARERERRTRRLSWTRYDLETDPLEIDPLRLGSAQRRSYARLRDALLATRPFFPAEPNILDPAARRDFLANRPGRADAREREEDLRRLRALGYLQ